MSEETQDQKTESDTTEATADGLEDLEPSEEESEDVTGGSTPITGWDRVKNPRP